MPLETIAPLAAAAPARATPLYPRAAWYFAAATLVTVAGFFPTYFKQLGQTDAVHHFHGITALGWLILLVAQAALAARRELRLHRVLGWFSVIVAVLLVVSGALVVRVMLATDNPFNRQHAAQLAFIDVTTLLYFATAIGFALYHRRNQPLHARLMASTAVIALPPGLARLIDNSMGLFSFEATIHVTYAVCGLIAAALLWDDRRKGRIRAPYLTLAAMLVVQDLGFWLVPHLRGA